MHHVPLQRHQAEGMIAAPHNGDTVGEVVRHDGPAQQAFHNFPVLRIAAHQLGRHAEAARHPQHIPLPVRQALAPDGAPGQERRPAQMLIAQEVDQALGGLLVVRDDILLGRSQRHVHRRFIFLRHAEQLAQGAVNGFHIMLPGVAHHAAYGIGVALHFPGHFRQQLLPAFHAPDLVQLSVIVLPGLNHMGVGGLQRVPGFLQRVRHGLLLVLFRLQQPPGLRHRLFQALRRPLHFLAGGGHFHLPGFHGGEHRFQAGLVILSGGPAVHGLHHGRLLIPGLQRVLPVPAAVPGLGKKPLHFRQTFSGLPAFLRQALPVLRPALPPLLHGAQRVLRLVYGFHAGHQPFPGTGDLFIQGGDLRLAGVPVPALFLQGDFRLLQGGLQPLQIQLRIPQPGFHPVAAHQEKVQIQHLQLRGLLQINPGVPALLLQRAQLPLQLLQDIVHPAHVVQRMGQLLVRLFLPGLELHDAGRFLEHQTPVLTLAGKDIVNPALADDGIAFLADARVPEKIDHVLQPAGGPVQVVFALPAAVQPPGHHHLGIFHRQSVILVVKDQGHLAVAQGLALLGTVENHVLHAAAPQGFGALLPQHPAHRVADIALSGSVWAHDARNALVEQDFRPLGKGLEPIQFQFLQSHTSSRKTRRLPQTINN